MTDDITWQDMTSAGVDIASIHREPNGLGGHEYVMTTDTEKLVFGQAVDVEDGSPWGFSVSTYAREGDGWQHESESWFETAPEALTAVRAWQEQL